jgi:hypothetical protein
LSIISQVTFAVIILVLEISSLAAYKHKTIVKILSVLKKYLSNISRILLGYGFISSGTPGAISITSKENIKRESLGVSIGLLRSRRLKVIVI